MFLVFNILYKGYIIIYSIEAFLKVQNKNENLFSVAECVEDRCDCRHPNKSPFKIYDVVPMYDGLYSIMWKKYGRYNLTVHEIY